MTFHLFAENLHCIVVGSRNLEEAGKEATLTIDVLILCKVWTSWNNKGTVDVL